MVKIAPASVAVWLTLGALATAAPRLAFALSPRTEAHLALQPQADHHRIHVLVEAQDSAGTVLTAKLQCLQLPGDARSATVATTDSVDFYVTENLQTFALYLRTPKRRTTDATYVLEITARSDHGTPTPDPLVYSWTIERNDQQQANIVRPAPGQSTEVMVPVSRLLPMEGNNSVRWTIVSEVRVITFNTPQGFEFKVDKVGAQTPVFFTVRPL